MTKTQLVIMAATIGAFTGAFFTYRFSHIEARVYFENIIDNKPKGLLVLASKNNSRYKIDHTIDLEGNVGFTPGRRHKNYSSNVQDNYGLSLTFAYVPEPSPLFGDPILVSLKAPNGMNFDRIVRNGHFGVLYEDNDLRLSYIPKPKLG